eukprot:jgi/Ulvmu1/11906/UM081_0065.1
MSSCRPVAGDQVNAALVAATRGKASMHFILDIHCNHHRCSVSMGSTAPLECGACRMYYSNNALKCVSALQCTFLRPDASLRQALQRLDLHGAATHPCSHGETAAAGMRQRLDGNYQVGGGLEALATKPLYLRAA